VLSSEIGQLVAERLRWLDQVAYVRFASVYREFKTLDQLVEEARAVIDARRYDVPGQGRLFIEPAQPAGGPNGGPRHKPRRGRKPRPGPRQE
jgi:transcriptional repressor NrdR